MRLARPMFAAALSCIAASIVAAQQPAVRRAPAAPSGARIAATVDSLANAFIREPQAPGVSIAIAGTYALALPKRTLPITIRADSAAVVAQAQGQGSFPLTYIGNDTFAAEIDPTIRIRFVIENGRAVRMVFTQHGATFEGARTP